MLYLKRDSNTMRDSNTIAHKFGGYKLRVHERTYIFRMRVLDRMKSKGKYYNTPVHERAGTRGMGWSWASNGGIVFVKNDNDPIAAPCLSTDNRAHRGRQMKAPGVECRIET